MSQRLLETPRQVAPPERGLRGRLRRVGKIVAGSVLVLVGLALVVLPGPAFVVLPAGLALLATEIPWLRVRLARGFDRLPEKVRAKTPRKLVGILHPAD